MRLLALLFIVAFSFAPRAHAVCTNVPFGVAGYFNLFALGDIQHHDSDTEGRVAAWGNASFENYSLGKKVTYDPHFYVLVCGGNLSYHSGNVWGGPIAYGGSADISTYSVRYFGLYRAMPIDFPLQARHLWNLSKGWAKFPQTGYTEILQNGKALRLTGNSAGLNVFHLTGKALSEAKYLEINVAPTATVLVNVDGLTTGLKHFGFELHGLSADRVIYNFHEATTLTLLHVGIQGTVLAPFATVSFENGAAHGGLFVAALKGNGQINVKPFNGCIDLPEGVVVPAAK